MTRISPHFTLEEFTFSATAIRLGQPVEVVPGSEVYVNLERLAVTVLEPLRLYLGGPVRILSGYRPPWLNALVGGAKNSAHMRGLAADIVIAGYTPLKVCKAVVSAKLPARQVIHEFGRWCHVAAPALDELPSLEQLTASHGPHGKIRYEAGLVEVG